MFNCYLLRILPLLSSNLGNSNPPNPFVSFIWVSSEEYNQQNVTER